MKQNDIEEIRSEEKKDISEQITHDTSHESLWGAVLFACMLLFVIASIYGVGWVAYTKWQNERTTQNQPSIEILSKQIDKEDEGTSSEPKQAAALPEQESSVNDSLVATKKLEISVLNGGATKGSAGILADFLKKEGYSKTDAGNAVKDYSGVVVYYAVGLEKEATIVKESVAKKYPQAKALPADVNNKETAVSQMTIILGK